MTAWTRAFHEQRAPHRASAPTPEPLAAPPGAGAAPGCAAHEEALREAAAFWFTRHRDGELDTDEAERFAAWLAASPEHEREYALLDYLWKAADLMPEPRCALAEAHAPRAGRRRNATRALAIAASLVVAAGAAWLWVPLPLVPSSTPPSPASGAR